MRKAAQQLLLVFLGSIMFSAPAQAQISLSVTLPFAFQVEEIKFPQGAYLIKQDTPDKKITIRSQKGREVGLFAGSPLPPQSVFERDQTWLVFHRYGDKYFLSEIWSHHLGQLMTTSSAEKQLRESGAKGTDVRVNVK
ncbi:MAG: hypothetical protein ABSG52_07410 [Terriglobales bacterium]|jgi:hypothetical protein